MTQQQQTAIQANSQPLTVTTKATPTATKTAKQTALEVFMLGNQDKLDFAKTSAIARKIDNQDKSENAKRFFAMATKRTNRINDLIENVKTRLFADVKAIHKQSIAKDYLLQVFCDTKYLDSLPFVAKLHKSLTMQTKSDSISAERFIELLKLISTEHIQKTDKTRKDKLADLSEKAKAIFSDNIKTNFVKYLADRQAKLDAKATKKADKK